MINTPVEDQLDYQQLVLHKTKSKQTNYDASTDPSFVTYIPYSSLQKATVGQNGMVLVTVREGWEQSEQWDDTVWFLHDQEYQVAFTLTHLQQLALKQGYGYLPPHLSLPPLDEHQLIDVSSSEWRAIIEVKSERVTAPDLREHIQAFIPRMPWLWRAHGSCYLRSTQETKCDSTTYRVEIALIERTTSYWAVTEFLKEINGQPVRPARFEELFAFSKQFPYLKTPSNVLAAGSFSDSTSSKWPNAPPEFPIIESAHRRHLLRLIRDGEHSTYGKNYYLIVTKEYI